MKRPLLLLLLPLLALALPALAADPTANRLPDAGIRLAGTNAVVSALEALRGMTGDLAPTHGIPYPDRFARLLKEKAGLTLDDRPFFFLIWLPEGLTGAATPEAAIAYLGAVHGDVVPGQLLILPVEEDGSGDFPALAADAENDAAIHRGRWFYLAVRPEAKAFAERCGADPFPVLASCKAFHETVPPSRGVAQAFLREPARFRPLRDGLLAKRAAFHANLARLRERASAGEDVGDELRFAEHMEEHAKVEEAIGDMLFSLLDASRFARIDLDCDATRGLRVIRGLEGIPHDAALNERIALRCFLEDNLPFLAFPAPEDAAWQEARRVARDRFVARTGHLTDIWTLPPAAVRTIADWIRIYSENPDYPASLAESAESAPDPSRLPDEFVLVPAAVDSYTAVPPPPGLVPNWLYAVGIDHRDCFELVCTDREKKHFCTLGTRASIYSSFKLEWLDADTLLYTSGDIGTWAVFPTEEGRWNIRAATVRRNDSGAVESFELDYWLYPTNFTPQWPAIPALPATPSPAEETHAERAETAEPESHAEGAE